MKTKAEILGTREHEKIRAKKDIWKLTHLSYKGGIDYIRSGNLFQYRIEDNLRYKQRVERADYQNHTQQLIDMIVGFVYGKPITRDIDKTYDYIKENISKGCDLQSFMKMMAVNCLKSTCGILVDSPAVSENLSVAERRELGRNPFAVYYDYTRLCDFDFDDNGVLKWVILDNSYIEKSDPYTEPKLKKIKRLWTRETFQDVEIIENKDTKKVEYILSDEINHGLGLVPFHLVNSRDADDDHICDSPFEDIALKSRKMFNITSWCDETLAGSSFQVLFFPYDNKADLDQIKANFNPEEGGISDLPVIPFRALSQAPFFDGPKIDHIDKYIALYNNNADAILEKFGFKRESSGVWESGVAKSIDFEKTEAILRGLSGQLQQAEYKIVEFCSAWEDRDIKSEIVYPTDYEKEDFEVEINKLSHAFTIPSVKIQNKAYKEITKKIFANIEQKELDELLDDIEADSESSVPENDTLKNSDQSTGLKKENEDE